MTEENEKKAPGRSLIALSLVQAKRIARGVCWRIRYRYKRSAKLLLIRACGRKGYRWIPVRLNKVQSSIIGAITSHPSYRLSARSGNRGCDTLSVVIPHYNQQSVLAETIDSILRQTVMPIEVLVVDDSSADRSATRAVLDRYSSEPAVRAFFPDEKLYSGGARNFGADRAVGDAIVFVDSDDILHPQRLEFIRKLFRERDDATFAITGTIPFTDEVPEHRAYDDEDFHRSIIGPDALLNGIGDNFACSRLSWIDKATGKVPWYAWGSYGMHRAFQPHSGAIAVRRESWPLMRFTSPRTCVFSPYEDYEYCFLMQALTRGGYQIDLPLIFYRRGFTTHMPKEAGR